jgi:hypothetical protein
MVSGQVLADEAGHFEPKLKGSIGEGSNPFELFRSEFGQNSLRIEEILLEFMRNPKISGMFNIFYKHLA